MERLYSHPQHLETNRLIYSFGLSILAFEGTEAEVDPGCLPFTISFRKWVEESMEHNLWGRSSGKFPGATEYLKR